MRPNRHVWDGDRVTLPGAEGRLALETWIEAATRGFSPPAQERISLEIAQHYFDSVAAQVADGIFEPVAHFRARIDLGDPRKARRRFRRYHLTESDVVRAATIFSTLQRPWRMVAVMALHVIIVALAITSAFSITRARNGTALNSVFFLAALTGLVGTGVVLPAFMMVRQRSGGQKPNLRAIALWILLDWLFAGFAFFTGVTMSANSNPDDLIFGWIMVGTPFTIFVGSDLFLWRKVWNMADTDLIAEIAGRLETGLVGE